MICKRCGEDKPEDCFGIYLNRTKPQRRKSCKLCRRIESKKRYDENPDIKEKMKATAKAYHFMKNYGLSPAELTAMYEKQDYRCLICNLQKPLNVDHCHITGKIRGLLCWDCNTAIGKFKDNPIFLQNAIKYLNGE